MYEVTCFRCLRIVHITPDNERCSVCNEDLKQLIPPAFASRYFYDRAAHFAGEGQLQAALAEVERGLAYHESSELHLLGGILAKRLSDFDLMRQHVAAIPLDDVLRQEAEWLLRSHQTRQRNLRQADKARKQPQRSSAAATDEEALPFWVDEVAPSPPRPLPTRRGGGAWLGVLTILLVVAVGWALWGPDVPWLGSFWSGGVASVESPETQSKAAANPSLKIITDTQPSLVLTPTVPISLTPDVPNDVVKAPGTPQPVAATTPGSAVIAGGGQELFDLKSFLMQKDRSDLAQLDVSAARQDKKLKLTGIVQMDAQRRELIDLAQSAPDIREVDAVELLVRLPPTYTVQEGDTLWDITFKLYGSVNRMQDLIQANADQLSSPEALRVGMELKVPPKQ